MILLQQTVLAAGEAVAELYLRGGSTAGYVANDPGRAQSHFALHPFARMSTDTYFNAFPETHWLQALDAQAVGSWRLELDLEGEAEIEVVRLFADGARETITRRRAGGSRPFTLDIAAGSDARPARLAVELAAGPGGALLRSCAWTLAGAVERPARLVLGLCCFHREAHVQAAVARILDTAAIRPHLQRLVLVDQSGNGILPAQYGRNPMIKVVEQGNFGGTGGFTRVMMEALDEPGATHVVLLDDDVALEPECIRRIAVLLSLAPADTAIGGQMLDLEHPFVMHEAGALFNWRKLKAEPLARGCDLRRTESLAELSRPRANDYLGWFCCAMPLAAIRQVGLPMPFFINFDDIEYGLRLRAHGVRLLTMPGIALWHQTGLRKETRWKSYYYQRNVLLIQATRPAATEPGRVFAGRWLKAVWRKRDVVRPHLACRAAADFLAGPAGLPDAPGEQAAAHLHLCRTAPARCGNPWHLVRTAVQVWQIARQLERELERANRAWRDAYARLTSRAWWARELAAERPVEAVTREKISA